MSSIGGTTLLGGELSFGGVAPSLFGLIHPKNVDRGQSPHTESSHIVKRNLHENILTPPQCLLHILA